MDSIIKAQNEMFAGKILTHVTGREPYIRYRFDDGSYFEQYVWLGELNWIPVENGLPSNSPVGPETDTVLILTNHHCQPNLSVASGEYTEDGFYWHPDNPKVLQDNPDGTKVKVTHWANISLPVKRF